MINIISKIDAPLLKSLKLGYVFVKIIKFRLYLFFARIDPALGNDLLKNKQAA